MSIRKTKDGRTLRTGLDYTKFRRELHEAQKQLCIKCGRYTRTNISLEFDNSFHVSHRGSRGMGSGIRDDVVGPKRGQVEGGLCGRCHRESHGQ
jgi:hypothetical protein